MIPGLNTIDPKLPTHREVFCKTILCMLRNLFSHCNFYSTCVDVWQQSLDNLKNNFLALFLGFQKLLNSLRLLQLNVYLQ